MGTGKRQRVNRGSRQFQRTENTYQRMRLPFTCMSTDVFPEIILPKKRHRSWDGTTKKEISVRLRLARALGEVILVIMRKHCRRKRDGNIMSVIWNIRGAIGEQNDWFTLMTD